MAHTGQCGSNLLTTVNHLTTKLCYASIQSTCSSSYEHHLEFSHTYSHKQHLRSVLCKVHPFFVDMTEAKSCSHALVAVPSKLLCLSDSRAGQRSRPVIRIAEHHRSSHVRCSSHWCLVTQTQSPKALGQWFERPSNNKKRKRRTASNPGGQEQKESLQHRSFPVWSPTTVLEGPNHV